MLKVLVACGNGMGTSMLIKTKATKVFKDLGIEANISHGTVGEASASANQYDVVIVPNNLLGQFSAFKNSSVKIIGMKNVLSEQEMKDKLKEHGIVK